MFLNINVKYYKVERDSIILPKPYFYVLVSGGKKLRKILKTYRITYQYNLHENASVNIVLMFW